MTDAAIFYDVHFESLTRQGEELCGDQVKTVRLPDETLVVLADGLGSGVKANILARLTSVIVATMLRHGVSLQDVIETVSGTLPVCRERGVAYAAFTIVRIRHADGRFQVVGSDTPPPVLLKKCRREHVPMNVETVAGKRLEVGEGVLSPGDFLGVMSDGVPYAGRGHLMNLKWGWDEIAASLEASAQSRSLSAERLVKGVIRETRLRYGEDVGDDATFVGVLARAPRRLMVFTGPPKEKAGDAQAVRKLTAFDGRRVVCGGTTGNIVADALGEVIQTDESTAREDIPPIGELRGVDLLTEGILTLARALKILGDHLRDGRRLPTDRNGANLLADELLRSDSVFFLAGESTNPCYQNPLLPKSVSIRQNLVTQLADVLVRLGKDVRIEWC